jgi:FtsP/CotA-like multicopper oxidase with cupredoxin domain
VREGDLVEVTLVNEDIDDGVTLHWHGIDVPNAEDGVAGLTQNAVRPGERYTYRFRAEQAGTYWYHSHQVSSEQVRKGLFGAFIVEPREREHAREITVMAHSWESDEGRVATIGASDTLERKAVAPGTPVRLRLINTDSYPVTFSLTGAPFKVAAIDGADLNAPTDLTDTRLKLAAGGRYDVAFTMPRRPVRLGVPGAVGFAGENPDLGLLLSNNGKGYLPALASGPEFDPAGFGEPRPTPFGASSDFDREFTVVLDNRPGFYDGGFNMLWTINGEVFPDTPMQMVREGDLVKTTFVNRSFMDHPMHLHGHHVLVLSRNGEPIGGSPWWADTLNVAPGESYEVAFRADNPGIWMDHCHNLDHAAQGMTMHLAYEGVSTPFEVGSETGNRPE